MGRREYVPPDSDERDAALAGYALANRVNDMVASPNSDRYRDYLDLVRAQWKGAFAVDWGEQYRHRAKALVPRALDAYELREEVELTRDVVYFYDDENVHIAAVPDAMEGDLLGITAHCRLRPGTYERAKSAGATPQMIRQSQAMMSITGAEMWLHLNYYENEQLRQRRLSYVPIDRDENEIARLEEKMIGFLLRTRS